ncbi:MAG: hypothetical protein KY446_06500 [Proteobacteria bacterium]|nr:hypothetical protein [Pseudomonadota bacterium]
MTISVSPERSTLSLPGLRLRPEGAPTVRAGPDGFRNQPDQARANSAAAPRAPAAEMGALKAATSGLDRASSVTDAALAAADAVINLLGQLREAVAADRPAEAAQALGRIDETAEGAGFDGVNLLNGSLPGGGLRVPAHADGELSVAGHDLRPGGPTVAVDLTADRTTALLQTEDALSGAEAARDQLRDDAKRVGAHRAFVGLLSEAVTGGKDGLDVEGARLAALAIKQTLSGTSLSVSNGGPQTVLSLFR